MKQRKILVVDDEKNIRLMLSQALASNTTIIETAINGEEALQKLEQSGYDLLLLDLRMPGMDGVQVLRQVHAEHPKLPVILLTAHGTVETAVEAMQSGAVNFLQKPFSPREIREAVDKALQGHDSPAMGANREAQAGDPTLSDHSE
ncbi:MAG: sigma-54-dependent Fis family transcriptional regulator [Planctomycetia bacterium]|nr:sigma-54-dependent Fis family transcriptional regulator [Planctomycetia bacterium]